MDTVCDTDIQRIVDSIPGSSKDEKSLLLQDLRDCANHYRSLAMEFRFVALNGDRIFSKWNLKTGIGRIESVNGIRNPVLISKYDKLFAVPYSESNPKFLKHENEMSPEEYAWCFDLE